jgi:hypothetical protein
MSTLAELWWALERTAMKPGVNADVDRANRDPREPGRIR